MTGPRLHSAPTKPWTDEEVVQAQALKAEGYTWKSIAHILGRTYWSVQAKLRSTAPHRGPIEGIDELSATQIRIPNDLRDQLAALAPRGVPWQRFTRKLLRAAVEETSRTGSKSLEISEPTCYTDQIMEPRHEH